MRLVMNAKTFVIRQSPVEGGAFVLGAAVERDILDA
jgi:hypothetical protein